MTTILKTVQAELKRRGWKRSKLPNECQRLGICSRQAVYTWINGKSHMEDHRVSKILAILDLTVSRVPGEQPEQPP